MLGFIGFIFWLLYWIFYIGVWILGAVLVLGFVAMLFEGPKSEEQRAAEQKQQADIALWMSHGSQNPMLKCPHCDEKGGVRTKSVNQRKGISGGKAVGAVLTSGVSLVATGISRREKFTKAFCEKCRSTWTF